jgi:hypothetical protein
MTRAPWDWGRKPLRLPEAVEDLDGPPCIVHLVRAANGLGSLRGFTAAMRAHPPGIEHRLVLAMKGFDSPAAARPYIAEAADLAPEIAYFPDSGFDLGLYFAAAARLRAGRYCFMNSHARPAVAGWLAKLDAAFDEPDVGLAGPSGSWSSFHSWVTYSMGLPSFYREVLPPIREARELLMETDLEQPSAVRPSKLGSLRRRLRLLSQLPEELISFPAFPAPHVRTATVMIPHAVLRDARLLVVRNKMDSYALESGPLSLTRQVLDMGLRAVVVDSDGATYEPDEWHRSGTLWQGQQERLLVLDNRTSSYERGDMRRRQVLAALAWGHGADPQPPPETQPVEALA